MQEEIDRLAEENRYFRARFLGGDNPLPPPPQLLGIDQLGPITNNAAGPSRQQTLSPILEEGLTAHLRPPVMVPGAPPPMKVIPPRFHNPGQVWQYHSQVPRTDTAGIEPEQPQLEVRNTRATSVNIVQNPPSSSSESLERVQIRVDQGPRRLPQGSHDHNGGAQGLELEGLNHSSSNQTTVQVHTQITGLSLDPGPSSESQQTSRPSTSDAQVSQQANGNPGVQFAVYALPQEFTNESPGATPRQSVQHLPDSRSTATASGNLSELLSSFPGLPSLDSAARPSASLQAQQPTNPNAQTLYNLAPATSSASTWGTVHTPRESRQSSFSNLPLHTLPEPAFDSQPASANPSISSIQQLPTLPGFLTSSSSDLNNNAFRQSSRHEDGTSHAGPSNNSRQSSSVTSLPLTEQLQPTYPSTNPPRSASSLDLGLMSFGNSSRADLSQQSINMHRASSSQSSLPEAGQSDSMARGASGTRHTPSRTQSTRPNAASQHSGSASSHSLPDTRHRRHTVSEDRHVGAANPKSSSQPSLPSSREGRPSHSRHASTPVATLPGVGSRTGVSIYLLPTSSSGSNDASESSNSVASRDSAISHSHPRSATAIPRTSPSEEPLPREPLRAQRRQSGRHASTPAILTQSRSDSQPTDASLARSNTFSASGSHPRPSTSLSSIGHSVPPVIGNGLLLTMEPPSTSSAATADGQPSTSIHAPRPLQNNRRSNIFNFFGSRSR
ncbi:hypothetical protein QCA50_005437 [Cerrena zonata]|uniref:Uncharacterized protein n=1 Tax=Cerrena zonata TaxID=2478898 RepID=A0AAW0GH80_9APHY